MRWHRFLKGSDPIYRATTREVLQRPSRRLWIVAISISVLCVGGLVYALVVERDTPAELRSTNGPVTTASGGNRGFALGVLVGVGAGIVIGSLIALRKRG
jgi:hypothetical protein